MLSQPHPAPTERCLAPACPPASTRRRQCVAAADAAGPWRAAAGPAAAALARGVAARQRHQRHHHPGHQRHPAGRMVRCAAAGLPWQRAADASSLSMQHPPEPKLANPPAGLPGRPPILPRLPASPGAALRRWLTTAWCAPSASATPAWRRWRRCWRQQSTSRSSTRCGGDAGSFCLPLSLSHSLSQHTLSLLGCATRSRLSEQPHADAHVLQRARTRAHLQVELHPLLAQRKLVGVCYRKGVVCVAHSALGSHKSGELRGHPAVAAVAAEVGKTPSQVCSNGPPACPYVRQLSTATCAAACDTLASSFGAHSHMHPLAALSLCCIVASSLLPHSCCHTCPHAHASHTPACSLTHLQVLLKYNMQRGVPVIPKASSPAHLAENIADMTSWRLSNQQKVRPAAAASRHARASAHDLAARVMHECTCCISCLSHRMPPHVDASRGHKLNKTFTCMLRRSCWTRWMLGAASLTSPGSSGVTPRRAAWQSPAGCSRRRRQQQKRSSRRAEDCTAHSAAGC